jgi:2-polyprenyl-6-methoxyphenol hydroxylase-like FAD-dependent oxidoreductase
MGWTAVGLHGNGRPVGATIENHRHERRTVRARLVVAADGRGSKLAQWARVPGRVSHTGGFLALLLFPWLI